MRSKEAQLRSNKAWRERNGLKLVQAWLPKAVVGRLDWLVSRSGARGRAALLSKLIEDAPAPPEETG